MSEFPGLRKLQPYSNGALTPICPLVTNGALTPLCPSLDRCLTCAARRPVPDAILKTLKAFHLGFRVPGNMRRKVPVPDLRRNN